MFAGRVIGRVIATRKYRTLKGKKLLLIQPLTWNKKPDGEPLVALNAVGAGAGGFVFYVKAREACYAFPDMAISDAAVVGIIDGVNIKSNRLGR